MTNFGLLLVAAIFGIQTAVQPAPPTASKQCSQAGIQQLRIYEIFENNKVAFHARFRDHALRIMDRHGFNVVQVWETRHGGRTEFSYLLEWPDEATTKKQWAAFMADEEWSRVKRDTGAVHGRFVGAIEERVLRKTDYSPCMG